MKNEVLNDLKTQIIFKSSVNRPGPCGVCPGTQGRAGGRAPGLGAPRRLRRRRRQRRRGADCGRGGHRHRRRRQAGAGGGGALVE